MRIRKITRKTDITRSDTNSSSKYHRYSCSQGNERLTRAPKFEGEFTKQRGRSGFPTGQFHCCCSQKESALQCHSIAMNKDTPTPPLRALVNARLPPCCCQMSPPGGLLPSPPGLLMDLSLEINRDTISCVPSFLCHPLFSPKHTELKWLMCCLHSQPGSSLGAEPRLTSDLISL